MPVGARRPLAPRSGPSSQPHDVQEVQGPREAKGAGRASRAGRQEAAGGHPAFRRRQPPHSASTAASGLPKPPLRAGAAVIMPRRWPAGSPDQRRGLIGLLGSGGRSGSADRLSPLTRQFLSACRSPPSQLAQEPPRAWRRRFGWPSHAEACHGGAVGRRGAVILAAFLRRWPRWRQALEQNA
jgi:hypothetical protein